MLKINPTGLIQGFIDRYLIWKDYQNFYRSAGPDVIEISRDGIPCFHYKNISSINACSSELVAIDNITEGIHSAKYFDRYNKNKKYIIFSNGSWDKNYYNLPIDYEIVQTYFFLWEMADTYNSPNRFAYYLDKSYQFDCKKPYSFISTIGNVRPERDLLVDQLSTLYPQRKFILRYSGQDFACDSNHLDVIKFKKGEFDPYTSILEKYYHNVGQSLPIAMYNSANFNLVVETDLDYQNCFFLTEKTLKVLISGMPFVSVSHPLFLAQLRELGFLTYNTLWDESYDQETDYTTRINKIVELCDFLCEFDWDSNRSQLELIHLKNRTNFLNLHKIINKEFENFENTMKKIQ